MINLNNERSLIGALISAGTAHIDGVQSVAFQNRNDLLVVSILLSKLRFLISS